MAKLRVPWSGWLWLLGVMALLAIGLFRSINLLTLLVCPLLVLWCLNALVAGRGLKLLRCARRIDSPIFAQAPVRVDVELTNPRRTSQRGVQIEDVGAAHSLVWFTSQLAGCATESFHQSISLPYRGRYNWGPIFVSSGYPFGFVRRRVRLVEEEEHVVLPSLGRIHRGKLRQYLARQAAAETVRRAPRHRIAAEAEFHGLRAFRPGDSPRWVHWRTTARRGELMVREFEDAPSENLILVIDPFVPQSKRGRDSGERGEKHEGERRRPTPYPLAPIFPALEAAISFAATVSWEWRSPRGNQVVLGIMGAEPVVLSGETGKERSLRLLEHLAVLDGREPGSAAALATQLAATRLPATPVLLVSAGPDRFSEILARQLNRPVAVLSASDLGSVEFYEGPEVGG
jgi:uncharacterized protein (DUF58 family)